MLGVGSVNDTEGVELHTVALQNFKPGDDPIEGWSSRLVDPVAIMQGAGTVKTYTNQKILTL